MNNTDNGEFNIPLKEIGENIFTSEEIEVPLSYFYKGTLNGVPLSNETMKNFTAPFKFTVKTINRK